MNPNSPHQAFLCQKLIDIIDYSGVPLQLGALPLDQDGSISEKLYNGRGNNLDPLDLLTIYPLSDIEKELLTEKKHSSSRDNISDCCLCAESFF